MAKIYYRKIIACDINPATREAWKIEDVPERWREEVQELLNGNTTA